jgi:hypothetical protein
MFMRMLMYVKFPLEPFSTYVRDGSVGQKMKKILDAIPHEAVYFTEHDGHRGGIMVVNLKDPSDVPVFAEPFFLTFHAQVEFRVVMSPEDLGRSGIDSLAKKWA